MNTRGTFSLSSLCSRRRKLAFYFHHITLRSGIRKGFALPLKPKLGLIFPSSPLLVLSLAASLPPSPPSPPSRTPIDRDCGLVPVPLPPPAPLTQSGRRVHAALNCAIRRHPPLLRPCGNEGRERQLLTDLSARLTGAKGCSHFFCSAERKFQKLELIRIPVKCN